MKKVNMGPTDKLHEYLSSKGRLYNKWHSKKLHYFTHWMIFGLLIIATGFIVLTSGNQKTDAAGGGIFLINATVNKSTAVADGVDGITLTVFTYMNICDNPIRGTNNKTGAAQDDVSQICIDLTDNPSFHPEGGVFGPAISLSGSGNSYNTSVINSDVSGNASFIIKSTVAETKTITILNGMRDLTNEWGSNGVKTVTFTSPSVAATTTTKKATGVTAPVKSAPAPLPPAVPVLESLKVGNTQFAADKIRENKFRQAEKKIFSGKTIPNGKVLLYFQSDPFEDTVQADKDGNWSYELTKDIGAGEHTLQIAVTDSATNLTSAKSTPIEFSVIAETATAQVKEEQKKPIGLHWYLLGGGLFLVLILGGIESYLYFKKGKGFVLRRFLKSKIQTTT